MNLQFYEKSTDSFLTQDFLYKDTNNFKKGPTQVELNGNPAEKLTDHLFRMFVKLILGVSGGKKW